MQRPHQPPSGFDVTDTHRLPSIEARTAAGALAAFLVLAGCDDDSSTGLAQTDGGSTTEAQATDESGESPSSTGVDSTDGGTGDGTESGDTGVLPDTCSNDMLDPGEEAVDCGGLCEVCPGTAFADEPLNWSVPSGVFTSTSGGGNPSSHTTLDLNGDGLADLVSTHDAEYEVFGGNANPHWRVHFNTGDGFADEASEWSLPSTTFRSTFGGGNPSSHATMDLDGDGRPDLVNTHDAEYEVFGDAADPHWRMSRNVAG